MTADTITNQPGTSAPSGLEQVLSATTTATITAAEEAAHDILPLEEYVNRFSVRYQQEEPFRDIVHEYLDLSGWQRINLVVGKRLRRGWYQRQTASLLRHYAERTRTDLLKALDVRNELQQLQQAAEELEGKAGEVRSAASSEQTAQQQYQQTAQTKEEAARQLAEEGRMKIQAEEERKRKEAEEIQRRTNAEAIARQRLQQTIAQSALLKANEEGVLSFDEERITAKLEDMFLGEIVEGIEKEEGNSGFIARITAAYSGLFSHYDVLEDIDELPNVDWVESSILSRSKGHRYPTFPYLIVGKPERRERGRLSLDTAIIMDTSGSMKENQRLTIARKTSLATRALMRKLNPQNETSVGVYSDDVREVTSVELLRSVYAEGNTRTDLALEWLIKKLQDSGGIAYLLTDGVPWAENRSYMKETVTAAEQLRNYPNILLRIFLIDGDEAAEENIRKIGRAAGPQTKFIPVQNYQLGSGVIQDISKAMGEMYDLG